MRARLPACATGALPTATVLTAAVLAVLLMAGPLSAQGATSGIRGVVTNEDGAPVARVRVEIRADETGTTVTGLTDAEGRYLIANVAAGGPYTITTSHLAYGQSRIEEVQLVAGTVHRFDFRLTPAALALPEVEVRVSSNPRFGTERSGAATVVTRDAVISHPTIERNVMELTALSPMAASTQSGLTIAGQNARFNAFQLDGGRFQDMFGASADGSPGGRANARPLPIDAVEQFQVLVAPFDVRQSGFTGGLMNAVTRSGTNEWQASGFSHYRDGSFVGGFEDGTQSSGADGFRNSLIGATVGGPIVRDRAHILVSIEAERRSTPSSGYNVGSSDPFAGRVQPDSAMRFAALLDHHAIGSGTVGQMRLDNPRENVFVRADWQVSERHRLTARHNYAGARRDMEPERGPLGAYEFGSNTYAHKSGAHSARLQLISSIGERWSNDLTLDIHRMTDRTEPASNAPGIEVDVVSAFDSVTVRRRMRGGGHFEAQMNSVDQSGAELGSALTGAFGSHVLTFGGSAELLRFNSLYVANPNGTYTFENLAALELNTPTSYERTLILPGADPAARFDVAHFSLFAQDEWSPGAGLTLHAGLRVDMPRLTSSPATNPLLLEDLGVSTSALPRTAPLWSPRVAFNWQSSGRYRTQLRGGAGLFTGRPAYAWLANAYAQTGLQTRVLRCDGSLAPRVNAAEPPTACVGSQEGAHTRASAVTLFSENFRFPQDLRFAGGFDQALPFGLVASGDFVLAIAQRQVFLRDINLGDEIETKLDAGGFTDGYGYDTRTAFGIPVIEGFRTRRRSDAFNQVIQLDDNAENRALAASFELSGILADVDFRGAYTYTRSLDVQSLTHRDAAANLGSTATYGHPNAPDAVISDFNRPHKVLVSLSSRVLERFGGTDVSLLYIGESGAPYSYVYGIDINGDGFPGPGTLDAYNDPIYVPELPIHFPGTLGSAQAFERMRDLDPCLAAWWGLIMPRNACRGPALHRLDLRIAQRLDVRGTEVRLVGDILNVLDLVGSRYGRVAHVVPLMPLLDVQLPRAHPLAISPHTQPLRAWYNGAVARGDDGRMVALPPATLDAAASRWQAQIGFEIRR